jgi:hypothetical protein
MSNAASCRRVAAHFAERATFVKSREERRACRKPQRLWSETVLAERFDRERDGDAKAQIYAMIGEVGTVRRKVA